MSADNAKHLLARSRLCSTGPGRSSLRAGSMMLMLLTGVALVSPAQARSDRDVLDTMAAGLGGAELPQHQPLIAVAFAGDRIIAVGWRGLIAYSDNQGRTWTQSTVPVQDDLVGVQFIDAHRGWAVGHDGVILTTGDGGKNWIRQLDARDSEKDFVAYYAARLRTDPAAQGYLDEIRLNMDGGSSLPYLSICFIDDHTGYAVGSFGMIVKSSDGGAHWIPWLDHIDNPQFLNLNSIRNIDGELYIAGEQGSVFHLDRAKDRFVAVSTAYKGSFFDIVGNKTFLLAVGLKGSAYRSTDKGASWTTVQTGIAASLTAGTMVPDTRAIVLVAANGDAIVSDDQGMTFRRMPIGSYTLLAGITAASRQSIVLAGYQGATVTQLAGH